MAASYSRHRACSSACSASQTVRRRQHEGGRGELAGLKQHVHELVPCSRLPFPLHTPAAFCAGPPPSTHASQNDMHEQMRCRRLQLCTRACAPLARRAFSSTTSQPCMCHLSICFRLMPYPLRHCLTRNAHPSGRLQLASSALLAAEGVRLESVSARAARQELRE